MKRVLIIGGGFAGLTAARVLSHEREVAVTLVNRFENMQFRPLLPDIVSRTIPTRYIIYPIENLSHAYGFRFILDEAREINPENGYVTASLGKIPYDYLILATGSETNFYGNDPFRERALKLDDVFDGERISHAVFHGGYDRFVVCGGGYTGVEIASHIRKSLEVRGLKKPILIVEMLDSILGPLPEWMKDYTCRNLEGWNIDIFLKTQVSGIENREVTLSNGDTLSNTLLVWSAGMKAPEVVGRLDTPKESQGRIAVDATLRFKDNAFAVGNTGCYKYEGECPRMATQMAVRQGEHAARNVLRSIRQDNLLEFRPVDFGYFVPMANWRSCGEFLGRNIKGTAATFLHYLISAYRSRGLANKCGVMRYALANK